MEAEDLMEDVTAVKDLVEDMTAVEDLMEDVIAVEDLMEDVTVDTSVEDMDGQKFLDVLWIYMKDFCDIFVGAYIAMFAISKALLLSSFAKASKLPEEVGNSLFGEFRHIYDSGPVPDDFDYSCMVM
ncbi:unnamed protein product [Gongylonema pulchrum]|uniref:V-type proton ATPase subunit a n=1 Tax=Gongylonema pulchrum TaxID=637853 RepID=A0A183ES50_9BILA|nr:unnamed protein product [Gongylonema pulchrum]